MKLIYEDEAYAIRGAIIEVHKEIGAGFLEAVYQECLSREFADRKVPFVSQPSLEMKYKGEPIGLTYQPDFVCYNKIIIEIKSVKELNEQHEAQVYNYMKAFGSKLGFLVNFSSHPKATIKRFIRTNF